MEELFDVVGTKSLDSNAIDFTEKGINFVGRTYENNGIQGKIQKRNFEPNEPFTVTATVIGNYKYVKFQRDFYYCSQNINKLSPKPIISKWNRKTAHYLISNIQKFVSLYDNQQGGYKLNEIKNHRIYLPITHNNTPDYDFMEEFIAELERANKQKLKSYLAKNGLTECNLTDKETECLNNLQSVKWGMFNLKKLFGASTRGRRLKSLDRITGSLPFVTAGEADEGVSAFIGNNVIVFPENTTTIDMFGSAKYRNYKYGADDHIAVVHTQNLSKYASIFITQAIHKASYTGEFHYGRNFYAKDADELNISLPIKYDNTPDYDFVDTLILALHKLMVKDVVEYVKD